MKEADGNGRSKLCIRASSKLALMCSGSKVILSSGKLFFRSRKAVLYVSLNLKSKYLLVDETAVDKIAVDEPGPNPGCYT